MTSSASSSPGSATTSPTTTTVDTLEAHIRALSSIKERADFLKNQEDKVKTKIVAGMGTIKLKTISTVYGDFILRESAVYDFSGVDAVAKAETRFKEAKAALRAAKEAAKIDLLPTIKVTPTLNRNKAVSARTKKGHIKVETTCAPRKKKK